ncbi:MAG TPA: CoA transferase [Chloroflexota bacterium]|jgi:crotonobetainyl-CoA:carnitine CoA-transferase CaiB-like acyl-CoA transferase|nr:CoA transferase [Chloroflexota bacterium]
MARAFQPLQGIRVLDFSRILAGPYCTMVLADMGAEVIKIERPGTGDETRAWGPFVGGESAYFLCVNRNKKSVTVDLSKPPGQTIIRELATTADVLVENFRPGTMEKLGLGYDDLRTINPRLIYCAISGFGRSGPDKDRAGVDVIVEGVGGLMSITGEPDGPPVKVGVAIIDVATALHAHGAITAALFERERTGRGRRLDFSLLEVQIATLINIGSDYLIGGIVPKRWGSAHTSIVPYQAFEASDGYVVVGAINESLWLRFCEAIERPEFARDPRFASNELRSQHRSELLALIQPVFLGRTRADWLERFRSQGIPCGPINTLDEVYRDAQVEHLGIVQEVEHPTAGRIKLAGSPIRADHEQLPVRLPPPRLGQHTEEVLRELLQYDDEHIREIRPAIGL